MTKVGFEPTPPKRLGRDTFGIGGRLFEQCGVSKNEVV